jgi:hypothetical protein
MDRRNFLRTGSLAMLGSLACTIRTLSSARAAKAFPLNDSPFSAMNKEPWGQLRLSVVTLVHVRNI